MRGILHKRYLTSANARISPAHAGNTFQYMPTYRMHLGSAPHMRGILMTSLPFPVDRGISPAHAGNTGIQAGGHSHEEDQPRTCGEYPGRAAAVETGHGSAPHMRGIPSMVRTPDRIAGISPAHAGNTGASCMCAAACADQPRTCGEYIMKQTADAHGAGSAPHMRGIRCTRLVFSYKRRISPAHAGNTGVSGGADPRCGDQPRTCGEYRACRGRSTSMSGSAPHMRGIQLVNLSLI